jgi:hypothetical protein
MLETGKLKNLLRLKMCELFLTLGAIKRQQLEIRRIETENKREATPGETLKNNKIK